MRFLLVVLLVTSCVSRAWVIEYNREGGIIGYQNRGSDVSEKIRLAANEICPGKSYIELYDRLNSQNYAYSYQTTEMATTNHSGTVYSSGNYYDYSGTSTTPVSTTKVVTGRSSWREKAIKCDGASAMLSAKNIPARNCSAYQSTSAEDAEKWCVEGRSADSCFAAGMAYKCGNNAPSSQKMFQAGCLLGDEESCHQARQ